MAAETIDHSTLTELVEAGALRGAHVVGQPGGWSLRVKYGAAERALAAQRSRQVRVFRRIETLVSYLKDVGIEHFDVDAADYQAEGGKTRPDRAEAMRRAHEAAAHDKWFRDQIEEAIKEADDPNTEWVPHEVVKQDMARQRAELLARIKGGRE
ncbi:MULTISPECIES: hypothetical protein [Hyphomicrobiales]|uniref:Polynucleotide 5'-kinase involved in rRNA processing n=2 Tax=Hyphomicrobiales TaxID=356 RepID=A0A7W6EJ13_9HYPH|nr:MULTISPECIES: hypothetical protein [Hyphomicrobiales]MCK9468532.1 hypothetical protein [Porticoccaceae bacterium]MBB3811668.1 polynucleotide 5'-kinase involved in rRNA processing [Pseudochelatococcus contaminans]MDC7267290.1 hypothetical protein [Shinella sp. HY16]MDC7274178.1 hypothetical protein [Shinella sp. YZ44]TDR30381.1 hypothetical protein DES43_14519 [Aquamicrobium defluvii]